MNIEQLEYRVRTSPNLDYKYQGDKLSVRNKVNGNKVSFANDSIKKLFDYFKNPKIIHEAIKEIYGAESRNIEIIKTLIEWDFLITDLELKERQCPYCNSNKHKLLVEHQNDYYKTTFKYVKCQECDLVYLNPCPSEKALDFFYAFKNYYSILPVNSNSKLEERLVIKSNLLRTQILQYCQRITNSTKILDVGSGVGFFASHLYKEFNCEVNCLDKDVHALSIINNSDSNISTTEGSFIETNFDSKYDFVTMWGFIEHEFSPLATFEKAYRLINNGGYLIVDAPNISGSLAMKSILHWPYLHSPYHICHFDPKTISKLVKKVGFEIVEIKYKKTGSYLLKYSDIVLYLIYRFKLFYSSKIIDNLVIYISRFFLVFEKHSNNRIVLIAKKNETIQETHSKGSI